MLIITNTIENWYMKCPSVTLKYRDHIGWISAKIISRLISVTLWSFSLSADPNRTDLLQRERPQILSGIGVGMENCRFSTFKPSLKRCKIGSKLLWTTNRNIYTRFRMALKSMTLNDLWARFKVTDSLNAAKMAKYSLVMTPTPCRVAGCIISIRPTYSCAGALAYLLTQLARGV